MVAIDPRRTRTARQCDRHLAIRPGTDGVLALGMARVILEEGLEDRGFVTRAATGLEGLRAQAAEWTPERVAVTCGVAAADVVDLARTYATTRPAAIRVGVAPQQTAAGAETLRAIAALPVLAGHWAFPGGGLFYMTFPRSRRGHVARPDLGPRDARSLDMSALGRALTDPTLDPPVKGLMIWCTNPAVVQPDAGRVREGLARDDLFTVVLEHFLTDTARYADIVLPSTTQLEHFDIVAPWGHHYLTVNHPAVAPLGEARSHGEVLRLLAARMGLDHPALQESDEELAASVLPPGVDLAELKARGWLKVSPGRPAFGPDGIQVRLDTGAPLPPEPPAPGLLQLLTPKAHAFLNSSFANMPRHRRAEQRPTLEMHPDDAAARGLKDGQRVVVRNARGAVEATLSVGDHIRPGVVALPGKWWAGAGAGGTGEGSGADAVANVLTPGAWTAGGQPRFNDTFVEVAPVP